LISKFNFIPEDTKFDGESRQHENLYRK